MLCQSRFWTEIHFQDNRYHCFIIFPIKAYFVELFYESVSETCRQKNWRYSVQINYSQELRTWLSGNPQSYQFSHNTYYVVYFIWDIVSVIWIPRKCKLERFSWCFNDFRDGICATCCVLCTFISNHFTAARSNSTT